MSTYSPYPTIADDTTSVYAHGGALLSDDIAAAQDFALVPRSILMPLAFAPPVVLCAVSWTGGGLPLLTDLGMALLTLACAMLLIAELVNFPRRFGVGGLVLFGGVLVWFCYDYLDNWAGAKPSVFNATFPQRTVAKAAFHVCLLVMMMSVGLLIPHGRWFERAFRAVPEPANPNLYFWLGTIAFVVGISPYFWFTIDGGPVAIWHEITGQPVYWRGGRTGNLNYNFSGYVAHFLDVGAMGALLAVTGVLWTTRSSPLKKLAAAGMWLFWAIVAYNGGRRGPVLYMALPVCGLIFIRHHAVAAAWSRRFSVRAYVVSGTLLVAALVVIQIQGYFRSSGSLRSVDLNRLQVTELRGNSMFSEGLTGYHLVPDQVPFAYNRFPGEGLIRAIPYVIYRFVIHPIPRAIWTSKPVDEVWAWYSDAVTGEGDVQGTTISSTLHGWYYLRFGTLGVLVGGLLWGWLMSRGERALQGAGSRLMVVLFALAFLVWMFRTYRDVNFVALYPIIIGGVFLWVFARFLPGWRAGDAAATDAASGRGGA